ncbi:50S ribosomal protein L6 [candidate division TA06 bacterium]|uniref:Large ribosomal subunit protein uL6 n=1 Tax=candidate division TA06 bacterium TaxID=2250710 RepID=A0A523UWW2_UNCT6|nr:MAG: 50S ribosomal protein L6 [candidate division TA06 bacterium]
MSRVGEKPIDIPEGVKVEKAGRTIQASGPKGVLKLDIHPRMQIEIEEKTIRVVRKSDNRFDRSLHGLTRSLVANMMTGVTKGYEKVLEVEGIGYKAKVEGSALNLQLGFSHPIVLAPPEGITFEVESVPRNPDRPSLQCLIRVRGIDKQAVGEIAAKVRSFRKPEPYKGTGIKYRGEYIRRKAGKTGV